MLLYCCVGALWQVFTINVPERERNCKQNSINHQKRKKMRTRFIESKQGRKYALIERAKSGAREFFTPTTYQETINVLSMWSWA